MEQGQFRCIHCGDYFNLSNEEQEEYDEVVFDTEPNVCDFCLTNNLPDNHQDRIDNFSDVECTELIT